jgi:hypothetical protein
MGSKHLPYGSLNPQIAQRFARRIPSTECVPTHSHLHHFSCRKNDANELARGLYPLTPVNTKPKPIPLRKSELFCPKSNMPETANLKGSGIHER